MLVYKFLKTIFNTYIPHTLQSLNLVVVHRLFLIPPSLSFRTLLKLFPYEVFFYLLRKSIIEVRVPVSMLIVRSTAFLDSVASILAFTKYFTLTSHIRILFPWIVRGFYCMSLWTNVVTITLFSFSLCLSPYILKYLRNY